MNSLCLNFKLLSEDSINLNLFRQIKCLKVSDVSLLDSLRYRFIKYGVTLKSGTSQNHCQLI